LLAVNRNLNDQRNLIGAGLVWTLLFAVLISITIYLASYFTDAVFSVKIGSLLATFAVAASLLLLNTHFTLILRGLERIQLLAVATILPRIVYILLLSLVIFFGIFTLKTSLQMFFSGFFIALIFLVPIIKPRLTGFKVNSRVLREEVKSYGIHLYVSNIWHEIFFHADKFLVSYFLSETAMAYYALGYMITFPLSHFSTALATTLFRRFSQQKRIDIRVIQLNSLFILLSVTALIFLREQIIVFLFSDKYLPTLDIIIPLALAFGVSGLSKPYTLYLMAQKRGKTVRNISIFVPSIQIILNLFLIPVFGIAGAAWTAFAVYCLDLILNLLFYYRLLILARRRESAA